MAHQLNMKAAQFQAIRKRLKLTVYGLQNLLGISLNTAYRYDRARGIIPEPIARLMMMLSWHGVPPEWRGKASRERETATSATSNKPPHSEPTPQIADNGKSVS